MDATLVDSCNNTLLEAERQSQLSETIPQSPSLPKSPVTPDNMQGKDLNDTVKNASDDYSLLRQLVATTDTLNHQSNDNAKSLQTLAFLLRASEASLNKVAHGTNTCVRESYLTVENSLRRFQEQLKCLISSVDVILLANDRNIKCNGEQSRLLVKSLDRQSEIQDQLALHATSFSSMKESVEHIRNQLSDLSLGKSDLALVLEKISDIPLSTLFSKSEGSSLLNEVVFTKQAVTSLKSGLLAKLSTMEDLMQRDEVSVEIKQLHEAVQRLEVIQAQGINNIEQAQNALIKELTSRLRQSCDDMNEILKTSKVFDNAQVQTIVAALKENQRFDSQVERLSDRKASLEKETQEYETRLRNLKEEVAIIEQQKVINEAECRSLETKLDIREAQFIELERRSHDLANRVSSDLMLNANTVLSASTSTLAEIREAVAISSDGHEHHKRYQGLSTPESESLTTVPTVFTEIKNRNVSFAESAHNGKENEAPRIRFAESRGKSKPRSISHQL